MGSILHGLEYMENLKAPLSWKDQLACPLWRESRNREDPDSTEMGKDNWKGCISQDPPHSKESISH